MAMLRDGDRQPVSTSLPSLDALLRGGLLPATITEVS
jgi:hypothetical protein